MEQNREPRNKPTQMWSIDLTTKEPRIHNEERIVSSTNEVGRPGQPHANE